MAENNTNNNDQIRYVMDGMGGNSYRNNNTMYRGNSYRNSYNGMGGYSRTGDTMDKLHQMMNEAQTDQEREAIRRVIETM